MRVNARMSSLTLLHYCFMGRMRVFSLARVTLTTFAPMTEHTHYGTANHRSRERSNAAIHFCPACNLQFGVAVRETMANNTDGGDSLLIYNTSVTIPEWTLQDGRGRSWRMVFYGVWNQMLKIFNAILSILSLVVDRENLGISCPRDFPSKDCLS